MGQLHQALTQRGGYLNHALNPQFITAGVPGEELKPYNPSIGEKLSWILQEGLTGLGLNKYDARHAAEAVSGAASFYPGVGIPMAMENASRDIGGGDYLGAGLELAMFAGPGAKIANKAALKTAKEMAESGASREAILGATGWFKGADDKWRFEIDDGLSEFRGLNPEPQSTPVRAALKHPKLYEAYPDLIPLTVHEESLGKGAKGMYRATPGSEQVAINWSDPAKDKHSTLLHELQHAIQMREGFGRGANPAEYASGAMFHERARSLQGALSRELTGSLGHKPAEIIRDLKYADPTRIEQIAREHGFNSTDDAIAFLKQQDEMRTPISQYKRTSGEVEARNTQRRHMMSDMQRRDNPPWDTEDVPFDQQIVRFK